MDDREIIQPLMKGSILLHIVEKMVRMEDAERFNESFATYLEVTYSFELIWMKDALLKF